MYLTTIIFNKNICTFSTNINAMKKESLDHRSKTPLYAQAEQFMRDLISLEEYKNGKILPSEVELSEQLHISRNTLRIAINNLVADGLLIRKKGYGTKVIKHKVLSGAKNWHSFSLEMKLAGVTITNFELHLSKKAVREEVSDFFGVDNNTRLVCLERLRGKSDLPFVYFISYFALEVPLSSDEDFRLPLYQILEDKYGIVAKTSKEEISARLADSFIAEKLNITTASPILVRKRYVYDKNNKPIEYNIGYYKAESFTYTLETERITE